MSAGETQTRERPHLRLFRGRWVCGLRYKSGLAWPIGEGVTPLQAMARWRFALATPQREFPIPNLVRAHHQLATLGLPDNALIRDFVRDRIFERYPCLK